MKTKEIIDLIDFIAKSEINEVNIETPEFKVFVKKRPDVHSGATEVIQTTPVITHVASHTTETPVLPAKTAEDNKPVKTEIAKNLKEIRSPMIGTFYRSPNPDSPYFVQIGDKVKAGQTVCIIEAMKLFNEIESEIAGTIVEILVENSTPVEYDQPLFLVDPS
jgi:acetyl-CoA carboxylase biotin carboxyl carrier protein